MNVINIWMNGILKIGELNIGLKLLNLINMSNKIVGNNYYLYKRTSKRVPGKKYPQPVDTYIGMITPDGIIEKKKILVAASSVEVREYGFSKAVQELCPQEWKDAAGNEWEDKLNLLKISVRIKKMPS